MASTRTQSFANHARIVPGYHYVLFGLVLVYLLWALYRIASERSIDAMMSFVAGVALVLVAFYARSFALRAQDRIIRLEMRLRLAELAPELKPQIGSLTIDQLCALRFACDAELPALARAVLSEQLNDRKAIKGRIRTWEPDWLRV
jgi:hypothetical protein